MPFDEHLAARVRAVLSDRADVVEKRMFGGLAFMVDGRMCCGIVKDDLMLKVGPQKHQELLAKPHARPMDFTGRPSKGMLYVSSAGVRTEAALRSWVGKALEFRRSEDLTAEQPKATRRAGRPTPRS
jgi:TfoX/Sxy family transcriptional regulator of competence genes